MRAHHREVPPKIYDAPLCWLPREVDNSAGCQVWVPNDARWGALAGLPLHFSYGRCKAFVLLRQEIEGVVQCGATELPVRFLSGSRTGKFHPKDAHLYVVGLNGWQTAAKADGSLQRVRPTDKALNIPVKMEVVTDGVKLTFSHTLDAKTATGLYHDYSGLVFFPVAVIAMVAFGNLLNRDWSAIFSGWFSAQPAKDAQPAAAPKNPKPKKPLRYDY